ALAAVFQVGEQPLQLLLAELLQLALDFLAGLFQLLDGLVLLARRLVLFVLLEVVLGLLLVLGRVLHLLTAGRGFVLRLLVLRRLLLAVGRRLLAAIGLRLTLLRRTLARLGVALGVLRLAGVFGVLRVAGLGLALAVGL